LIAIRRRLAAQGNGQAALGHGDVADPATLDVSPLRAVPETRWLAPGAKRRARSETGPATWTSP